MAATQASPDAAAQAQIVKKLFPIYMLFTERFGLPKPPIADVRALKANLDPLRIREVEQWMDDLDNRIDAYQMRSVVQSSNVGASELRIMALLERLLAKPHANPADRSKIDFMLAQLLATRLSLNSEHTPGLAEVAEVLEPVVGKANLGNHLPGLESLISELLAAQRLSEVKEKAIIERGREIKNAMSTRALLPENLVACSRFNFLLRKRCFELIKDEVKRLQAGLKTLADRGHVALDCSRANLSGVEQVSGLMEMCKTWQERKPDDYAHDNPFSQVLALQEIVERAVSQKAEEPVQNSAGEKESRSQSKDERRKPAPDVIQIYAELAALRREHEQLERKVHRQEESLVAMQSLADELRQQLASAEVQLQSMQEQLEAANSKLLEDVTGQPVEKVPAPISENVSQPSEVAAVQSNTASEAESKTVSMQDIVQSLTNRMEEIREALTSEKATVRKGAPTHLKLEHVSMMLTGSETQAFLAPATSVDDLICRGVAARFLLLESMREQDHSGQGFAMVVGVCQSGAAQLQEQAAQFPPEYAERIMETAHLLTKSLKACQEAK